MSASQNSSFTGPYRLAEQIAASNLGDVFRAEDTRDERTVALTLVRPELAADAQWRELLFAAARRALPASEYIQRVYEAGEAEGRCYVAAEPFTRTLRTLMAEWHAGSGRAFVPQGLALVAQAATALEAAHTAGIVHGTITSLLLRVAEPPGDAGTPTMKVGELGLAALAPDAGVDGARYRSPEQWRGEPALPQSDVYALGVVLHELIGNRYPFNGSDPASIAQQHQLDKRPFAPPFNDTPLRELVLRCLEKDPQNRYPSAGALAADLYTIVRRLAPDFALPEQPSTPTHAAEPGQPPPLPPPPPLTRMPQIEAFDAAGQRVIVQPLTGNGLGIRLHESAPIQVAPELDGAQIEVNPDRNEPRSRATVVAQPGTLATFLAGVPIASGQQLAWEGATLLQVGSYWLRLIAGEQPPAVQPAIPVPFIAPAPNLPTIPTIVPPAPPAAQTANTVQAVGSASSQKRPIILTVEPTRRLELSPDGVMRPFKVKVKNSGSNDESVILTLGRDISGPWVANTSLDMVQTWLKIDPQDEILPLGPGAERTVTLKVVVSKRSAHRAGDYGVTIQTRNREQSNVAPMIWSVAPYLSSQLRPDPRIVPGVFTGNCKLNLKNRSNIDAVYTISGTDPEGVVSIPPRELEIPAGTEATIPLPVHRKGFFRRVRLLGEHQYALTINGVTQVAKGKARADFNDLSEELTPEQVTFVHKPLIPAALVAFFLALLFIGALVLLLLFLLYPRPKIESIATAPTPVGPGTPISLEVQVRNAGSLEVQSPYTTTTRIPIRTQGAVITVALQPNVTPPPKVIVNAYGGPFDILRTEGEVDVNIVSPTPTLSPTLATVILPTATATPCLTPTLAKGGLFWTSRDTIALGEVTKLNWTGIVSAEKVFLSDIGVVGTEGTADVSPSETTTYTLTARYCGEKLATVGELVIQVIQPPGSPGPTSEPQPTATITPIPTPAGILSCPPRTKIYLTGTSSVANAPFFVYFRERVVGGGSTNADGSFKTALIVQQEYADEYPIKVRLRSDGRELLVKTYQVDTTPPASLSPIEAAGLRCVVPTPTLRPSSTPAARR